MAFGDAKKDGLDDKTISDNGDTRLVIQTVANAAHEFLGQFPDRQVLILPVDSKRKSLYNFIFRHHWESIRKTYRVKAFADGKWHGFSPEIMADAFKVSIK